ncbi:MAG: citrate synthase/methylcitrate synthase [Deltaproteobacteria bacterium]|nr:citrate synthase/methylcitrate synthase [Deltaproteobacteria bacterium]
MADPTQEIFRGLEGVLVATTKISKVDGLGGVLTYRGYDIHELAAESTFEETAWLLAEGELPTPSQYAAMTRTLAAHLAMPDTVLEVLRQLPRTAHPMAIMRTAISAYGCTDTSAEEITVEAWKRVATRLVAQIGTIGAAAWRLSQGAEPIAPDPSLGYAANFLYMLHGKRPTEAAARILDIALICHADHGIPASTFSGMVVGSSLTDLYSAITAAIGSLKGPLHGGANERVLVDLDRIGSAANVPAYMREVQSKKLKVMGLGHRVYKTWDPRAIIFKKIAETRAAKDPDIARTFATAVALEKACLDAYAEKQLYPNVDYYSGIVYRSLGIDAKMFTPIFAISRMAGWTARLIEYLPNNRIFRPRGKYEGYDLRAYTPLAKRRI